ncbi:hypothetical protein Tco_0829221 [Tanacetum coccineum]
MKGTAPPTYKVLPPLGRLSAESNRGMVNGKAKGMLRTEPRRRHGGRYSRSPSPHASVFKRLKKYRSPSPRLRPRKEGGVFNRLGRKEPATSARPDSRQRSPQAKRTEVEARRRQQKGTASRTTSQYSESEDSEGGHWKSKSR